MHLQIEPRQFVLLVGGAALLVSAAVATLLIAPEYRELVKTNKSLKILQNVTIADDMEKSIAETKGRIAQLQQDLHGEGDRLPIKQMEAMIIAKLEQIATKNQVVLDSVMPLKGNNSSRFDEVLFLVKVSGSYFDVYTWIKDLDHSLGAIVIKQFSIKPSTLTASYESPTLNVELKVAAYVAKR